MEASSNNSVPTNANNAPIFTCLACQVAFYSADQQRTHYRSNWHKYNLKRKVVSLPPVTAESFAQRVLAQQAKEAEASKRAAFSADCKTCKKTYGSENAFTNHMNSKKHKEAEARLLRKLQLEEDTRAEQLAIAESIAAEATRNAADAAAGAVPGSPAAAVAAAGIGVSAPGVASAASAGGMVTDQRGLKVSEFHISDDDEDDDEEDEDSADDSEDQEKSASPSAPMDVDQPRDTEEEKELERRKQEKDIKRQLNQATTEEEVEKLLEKKKAAAPRLDPESDCLFCTHKSDSLEHNIDHMMLAHSFFIPDLEYLVNLRGLIKYLADKLSVANVCLYCNGRGRMLQSLEAVRRHMLDKGHTKIAYETEIDILEISDFYDFSSTYPDAHEHDADEELDPDSLARLGGRGNLGGANGLEEEDGELVLPNGTRIGHRLLQRYYKQTILPERQEKESVVIHKMLTNYNEDPEYSTQVSTTSRNRAMILAQPGGRQRWKDIAQFKEFRKHEVFRTKVGIRNNRLQKHYREQNPL
ncbi:pre-60S factor rei1 [Coemansia sp. RSA 1939]|nr:pre-60S factor rei1 [Coemansia sp. RSA 1939]KAJ2607620.1 pre-60S factor rei1 [Coemansia sp. RSA 1804]